jgi:hypothetical protein
LAGPFHYRQLLPPHVSRSLFLARNDFNGLHITIAESNDELWIVFAQQTLHTLDRIALIVEQMTNALEQLDIDWTIIAATAATLHRLDLCKARFPETQHMLGKIEILRNFTDRPECIRALVHPPALSSSNGPLTERPV